MDTQNVNSNSRSDIYSEPLSGNNPSQQINLIEPDFFSRNQMVFKAILISFLTLFLMIPMILIGNLIREREQTAREASYEVHQKWSGAQTITGPVLTIPFYESIAGKDGKTEKTMNVLQILPETLSIQSTVETQELKRGLYEIVVYDGLIELKGSFVLPEELGDFSPGVLNQFMFDDAMVNIGISDLRGVSEQIEMLWGGEKRVFHSGIQQARILESGASTRADLTALLAGGAVNFTLKLNLKGSESLRFVPLGKTTVVDVRSNCKTPSFNGAFLPVERDVHEKGFSCTWKVMDLNRNYPQTITGTRWMDDINASRFGVDLLLPVQHYQKSMRTVKYAILIIVLTFVVSFFVELFQKKRIHPFQYLLIGAALCLFYSLLISISEHTGFAIAYTVASVMTVSLVTCYMAGVLKIKKTALSIGGLLSLLYLCIFILIQMETYALLAGSIGLFVILAVIMYFSQRINWNKN